MASFAFARAPVAGGQPARTFLRRQHACYPFHVTCTFNLPEQPAGMATLYLQSVSGGLYEGDRSELRIDAEAGAAAHVTTQSATVVHRGSIDGAVQHVHLEVAAGAFLEYLPDPVVMLPGARLESRVSARVADDAVLMLCDGLMGHRLGASHDTFTCFDSRLDIAHEDGRRVLFERQRMDGQAHQAQAAAVFPDTGGAQATLVCVQRATPPAVLLAAVRQALERIDGCLAGASELAAGAGVFVRVLAADGAALRRASDSAWRALREVLTGAPPHRRSK